MKCIVKNVGKTTSCSDECGTNLVCDYHRKTMNKNQKTRATEAWHDYIVEHGVKRMNPFSTYMEYQCYHCKEYFGRKYVCGDHFPYTKGSRNDLRYCTKNGVTTCKPCNLSNSPQRQQSLKNL